jgi:hypothetical protein
MNQLHKDLNERINERLGVWAADSTNLYDAGGLSAHDSAIDVFLAVLHLTVRVATVLRIDERELSGMIAKITPSINKEIKKKLAALNRSRGVYIR